jgi:hypothetical protein
MAEVSDKLARALRALRLALGVPDVLTNGRDTIWVMGGPRTLRRTLGPGGTIRNWLYSACRRESGMTVNSYLNNATIWDTWETAVNYGLDCLGLGYEWAVIPVPAKTLPRKAWSAKRQAWLPAGPKPRFRLCGKEPVWFGSASGPVLFEVASDLPPLMLSHGVSMRGIREVRKCGGLLWPSWALSWRMPPTYGDVVFFGSSEVLVSTLKPTGKAQPELYLAGTDIWSPTARELERMEKAVERELSGDRAWWNGDRPPEQGGWGRRDMKNDLLIEKLAKDSLVGGFSHFDNWEITEPIKTRRQLVRRFRQLFAQYTVVGDPYAYPERDPELSISDTPYPYGELKVMGLVELRDLPLVVYPRRVGKTVTRLLDEQGFQGVRLPISYRGPLQADSDDTARREYAALVTRSVLAWAQEPCNTRGAHVGEALRQEGSWRNTYEPTAWWITGASRTYAWQRGFCGTRAPSAAQLARLSFPLRDWVEKKQAAPGRWGLELASTVAGLVDLEPELGDLVDWYSRAEEGRFRLTASDARIANSLSWFPTQVARGDEVVVLNNTTVLNPTATATKARLLA